MPFTLSHAAAAWPFRRTRLVLSALLIGCFVPDFPYFLFLKAHGFNGHSLPGMFLFDLPVGLAALWLFQRYVKRASLIYLPEGFRRRLDPSAFSFLPLVRLALIALSILVGSATHILWDSFTHAEYWPSLHWSFLRMTVPFPMVEQIVMYKLLQYISTVAGIVFVAIWVWHWYRTTEPVEHSNTPPYTAAHKFAMWVVLPLLTLCGGLLRGHEKIRRLNGIRPVAYFTADAVITAISIFGLGLLVYGIFLRARHFESERA